VSESGGGNWEMSTFVPIEAKGGITLHPGPGPFAAGPGPFPARIGLSSSCSRVSAANAAVHRNVTAAAEISTARARFDTLLILSSILMCVHLHTSVRLIAELLVRDVVFLDRGYRLSTLGWALAAPAPTIRRLARSAMCFSARPPFSP